MKVEDWIKGRDIDIAHMASTFTSFILVLHPFATSPILKCERTRQIMTQNRKGIPSRRDSHGHYCVRTQAIRTLRQQAYLSLDRTGWLQTSPMM